MKMSEITYNRTFNLGNFNSERIGVRIEINEGESVTDALQAAKQLVEETHKANYPNLSLEIPIEETRSKEEIVADTVQAIMSTKTIEELQEYKLLKSSSKDIFHAYNVKEKQLQNA
jgi:cell fate regulator YaaT (PSP1 superfamily)